MNISAKSKTKIPGFTLVELLTVVAIIALLISILLPSLSQARTQAKNVKVAATLSAIDKGLEMFHIAFKDYPSSKLRLDPINANWPDMYGTTIPNQPELCGAHWLARAMVGHDIQGIDNQAKVMKDGENPANQIDYVNPNLIQSERKNLYIDAKLCSRDDNPNLFMQGGDYHAGANNNLTGRFVLVEDAFDSPILYYKANTRAKNAFCLDGKGGNAQGQDGDLAGIYNHSDNKFITGCGPCGIQGWEFIAVGYDEGSAVNPVHRLGLFGYYPPPADPTNLDDMKKPEFDGTFTKYLHEHSAHETANLLKPVNPDRFVLITAGKDGIYGTDDDINNFESQ
ncbi:MAG: type II secretion system protein [Planctomycetota bacterium]|jgi:prepilin-type N-terminal cleavage/methylation domain-containing protein